MDIFNREKEFDEVKMLNPLVWAYVGDSVYELYVRIHLTNTSNAKPHKLHMESIKYVKAKAQADILDKIESNLTEEELDIVRRGRNTENHHLPKNSNVQEYMYATAFEALIGYLYLTKKQERLMNILSKILTVI